MREPDATPDDIRVFFDRMAAEAPLGPVGLGVAVRKARRRIATTVVGALVVAGLAAGTIAIALDHAEEAWVPQPADPGPTFTDQDLPALVLSTRSDVVGVIGAEGAAGRLEAFAPRTATVVDVEETTDVPRTVLAEAGMRSAYLSAYSTARFGVGPGGTSLVSLAMRFPDRAGARLGLEAFRLEGERIWTVYRRAPTHGLGEEGFSVDGRVWGTAGLAIVWRTGNVVLFLGSQGRFTPAEFRALADEMDRRARGFA